MWGWGEHGDPGDAKGKLEKASGFHLTWKRCGFPWGETGWRLDKCPPSLFGDPQVTETQNPGILAASGRSPWSQQDLFELSTCPGKGPGRTGGTQKAPRSRTDGAHLLDQEEPKPRAASGPLAAWCWWSPACSTGQGDPSSPPWSRVGSYQSCSRDLNHLPGSSRGPARRWLVTAAGYAQQPPALNISIDGLN